MTFRIEKKEDLIEVHVWGSAHESEVLEILRKLREMAPRKEISDLWVVSEEYVVPWDLFLPIVNEVKGFVTGDMIGKKSAIVVPTHSQMAQAQLYLEEAKCLPYEVAAFMTREEAIRWLKSEGPPERAVQ